MWTETMGKEIQQAVLQGFIEMQNQLDDKVKSSDNYLLDSVYSKLSQAISMNSP